MLTSGCVRSDKWPEEAVEKLPDRGHWRKRPVLAELEKAAEGINATLTASKEPPLLRDEVVAAVMYTGPMFVKCVLTATAHSDAACRGHDAR